MHVQNNAVVVRRSMLSGKTHSMELPISEEEFDRCFDAWQNGTLIQEAFPMLDASQREFIMTGITDEEWDATYGEDE